MRKKIVLLISFLLFTGYTVSAKPVSFKDILKTKPTGFVQDFAGILDTKTKEYIESLCRYVEKKSTIEIAIVSVPELEDYSIEEAAVELFEKWGIGKKGKDNGLLFILSLNPRKVRIEVGYGLEGVIPDALAGRILDNYTLPYFKKNQFAKGTLLTSLALISTINKKLDLKLNLDEADKYLEQNKVKKKRSSSAASILSLIFFILILLFRGGFFFFLPIPMFFGDSGSYGGGSSFGGGGFGGFGGGMSGGGGASRGF